MSPVRGAVLLAALALAACGGGAHDDGKTVLRFVTWKPNQPAAWDAAIAKFEQAHPDIRVERQIGPHSSTAFHDLLAQRLKNDDTTIDVFLMDVIWPAEFAAAGWTMDLSDRFDAQQREAFLPGAIAADSWNGKIWAVPAYVDVGLLYYRRDLLARSGGKVPATWPELAEEARAVVRDAGIPGLVGYLGQFKQYEGLVCNMLEIITSHGGTLLDPADRRGTLDSPETLAAIRWARDDLVGQVAPRAVLTYEEPESLAVFLQGQAVFLRSWPYAWEIVNDPARSRVAGNVGVAALPAFPGHETASALGGWQYGINAHTTHPDSAWAFVEFMTSAETQRFFALEASLAPTRSALYGDPAIQAANPHFNATAFRHAVPRPVTPVYPAVSAILQRTFSRALTEPDTDLAAAARRADDDIDRMLAMVER